GTKLTADDGGADDQFGWSVAIDGNLALIGAPYDDDNGYFSGSAYAYSCEEGEFVEGACCINEDCSIETEADCNSKGGSYKGDYVSCTSYPCGEPSGACCIEADCQPKLYSECIALGGTFMGADTSCATINCAEAGACCMGTQCVLTASEEECTNSGGTYKGNGVSCGSISCCPCTSNINFCEFKINMSATSVDIDGDFAVVSDGSNNVFVFKYDTGNERWGTEEGFPNQTLTTSNGKPLDKVSISYNSIVVAEKYSSSNSKSAYIYEYDAGSNLWGVSGSGSFYIENQKLIGPDTNDDNEYYFGSSVGITVLPYNDDSRTAIVSNYMEGSEVGAVYLFEYDVANGRWGLPGGAYNHVLRSSDTVEAQRFGVDVSISRDGSISGGKNLIVGSDSPETSFQTRFAYIFAYDVDTGKWGSDNGDYQIENYKITYSGSEDSLHFGKHVAIDRHTAVVSNPYCEASQTAGLYIFQYNEAQVKWGMGNSPYT
ncbi:MAG: FG-GAP repeat protein, partial [Anaerolineales bacterium]|nr:FG-GAP repeat protein [Anaerolineales bacterium]